SRAPAANLGVHRIGDPKWRCPHRHIDSIREIAYGSFADPREWNFSFMYLWFKDTEKKFFMNKKDSKIDLGQSELLQQSAPARTLSIITAAAEDNALGKDNALVWHLPDDFKHFKKRTSGHKIIMGRKTFESFPKPLPNRIHIVITRDRDYKIPFGACIVVHSLEQALELVKDDSLA